MIIGVCLVVVVFPGTVKVIPRWPMNGIET